MNHEIKIPQAYLLILAARGKMGDGELPRLMQLWAEQECGRLGLRQQMLEEKIDSTRKQRRVPPQFLDRKPLRKLSAVRSK